MAKVTTGKKARRRREEILREASSFSEPANFGGIHKIRSAEEGTKSCHHSLSVEKKLRSRRVVKLSRKGAIGKTI